MIQIDVDLPKGDDEFVELVIFGDGRVLQTGESWRNPSDRKTYYTTTTPEKHFLAEQVPQHGRLIDADALPTYDKPIGKMMMFGGEYVYTQTAIDNAPTIIPAEEGE